jgi:hypothetical protein
VTKPLAEASKAAVTTPPSVEKTPVVARPAMVPVVPQEHKPALSNFTETTDSPAIPSTLAKGAAATASPSPALKNFDSVFKTPSTLEAAKPKTDASKPESKPADEKASPTLSIIDPLAEEEDVLDPVRDHGVPSFGAIGKGWIWSLGHSARIQEICCLGISQNGEQNCGVAWPSTNGCAEPGASAARACSSRPTPGACTCRCHRCGSDHRFHRCRSNAHFHLRLSGEHIRCRHRSHKRRDGAARHNCQSSSCETRAGPYQLACNADSEST